MAEATETGRSSGCSLACEHFLWLELGVRERKGWKLSSGRARKTEIEEKRKHRANGGRTSQVLCISAVSLCILLLWWRKQFGFRQTSLGVTLPITE